MGIRRVTATASSTKEELQRYQQSDEYNKAENQRLKEDLQRERDYVKAFRLEYEQALQAKKDADDRFARVQEQFIDVADAPTRAQALEKDNEKLQKECLSLQKARDAALQRNAAGGSYMRVATPAT